MMSSIDNSSMTNVILICGIPGCGKTNLANNISFWIQSNHPNIEVATMEFDKIEQVDKDNYSNFQLMRDHYFSVFTGLLNKDSLLSPSRERMFILDDNFYLKSMRKKIYQAVYDYYINKKDDKNSKVNYCEVFLDCECSFAIEMNSKRDKDKQIPNDVIEKMYKDFEYKSPYMKDNMCYHYNVKDIDELKNFSIESLILSVKNCNVTINQSDQNLLLEKQLEPKKDEAVFIDELELMLRKGIALKIKEAKVMSSKDISLLKKAFVKLTSRLISNVNASCVNIQSNSVSIEEIKSILQLRNCNKLNILVDYFINLIK